MKGPEGLRLLLGNGKGRAPKGGSGRVHACLGLWMSGSQLLGGFPKNSVRAVIENDFEKTGACLLPEGPQARPSCMSTVEAKAGLHPSPGAGPAALGCSTGPAVLPAPLPGTCGFLRPLPLHCPSLPVICGVLAFPTLAPPLSSALSQSKPCHLLLLPSHKPPPSSLLSVSPSGNLRVLYLCLAPPP